MQLSYAEIMIWYNCIISEHCIFHCLCLLTSHSAAYTWRHFLIHMQPALNHSFHAVFLFFFSKQYSQPSRLPAEQSRLVLHALLEPPCYSPSIIHNSQTVQTALALIPALWWAGHRSESAVLWEAERPVYAVLRMVIHIIWHLITETKLWPS